MAKRQPPDDVSIGKFDILATYTYAKPLLDGLDDAGAKQRGMVAAIRGPARHRLARPVADGDWVPHRVRWPC